MAESTYVFGWHAAMAVLEKASETVIEVWLDQQRDDARVRQLQSQLDRLGIKLQRCDKNQLDDRVNGQTHQGIVLLCKLPRTRSEGSLEDLLADLPHTPLLLILDGVTDPHNLGACLRSADAAGVDAVIIPKDRAVGLTPVVCKVASGAAHCIPVFQVTNLARTLKMLKSRGIWLVGTTGNAEQSIYELDLNGPLGVVMGAEGKGMRRLTEEACDYLANIPMAGHVSSLNVSVATGVVLFEAVRQRM